MLRYTLRRFVYMLVTLWVIVTLTFVLMHSIPGNPFVSNKRIPDAVMHNLMAKYGLDQPLWKQYTIYLTNLLHGDLGVSMHYTTRTVQQVIADGFPVSLNLGLRALLFAVPLGLALGILAALHRGKAWDFTGMIVAVVGVSAPSFVVGAVLQWILGVKWHLLPVAGWDGGFLKSLLPSFALSLSIIAGLARMMRTSMLDVLTQDYMKTARSKGLNQGEIVWRHAIRNALLPIVTILGPTIISVVTGTLVVERLFAIPGLGKYYAQSITDLDYTMILGTTVFYAVLLLLAMFVVDLAYGLVDPRIRLAKGGR